MPIYQAAEMTREQLDKLRKSNVCAVCAGWLNRFMGEKGRVFLACSEWPRSHHEGIMRLSELRELNAEARREVMTTELGVEKTRALERYAAPGTVMTRTVATEIVETLWKEAPPIEKAKAIMICTQYQLNPLMKHLYILKFNRWSKDRSKIIGVDWAIVLGIGATRLMAHRRHAFSYLDLTPRVATKDELEKIFGDNVDWNRVYFITKLKDVATGAEGYGLGSWNKSDRVKGEEKGNSQANMASIRSERQAYDRLYPGEMPASVDVVDERFIEKVTPSAPAEAEARIRTVDEGTGEIFEGEVTETGAQEQPDERVEQGQAKSTRTESPRDMDLRMLRGAASKLKWDKKRLDEEAKTRVGAEVDQLSDEKLHALTSKLVDMADCA